MQLLVQNYPDLSQATEIFSVPKRQFSALPKIVRYRNKSVLTLKLIECIKLMTLKETFFIIKA